MLLQCAVTGTTVLSRLIGGSAYSCHPQPVLWDPREPELTETGDKGAPQTDCILDVFIFIPSLGTYLPISMVLCGVSGMQNGDQDVFVRVQPRA